MTTYDCHTSLSMTLNWHHGLGALAPFFAALAQGRILASRCRECGHTTVPPRRRCQTDGLAMAVIDLPPTGIVRGLTMGAASRLLGLGAQDQLFAEVQVQGSDDRLLARIDPTGGAVAVGTRVRLAASGLAPVHPIQNLVFVADDPEPPENQP